MSLFHSQFSGSRTWVCGGILALCVVAGCGADTYQQRLNETQKYYSFLERIELNLAPKWTDGRIIEFIRVPKQFQLIPPPVPVKSEDGKEEMPAVDPRQPDFLNLVFPGLTLVAAWEAAFDVPLADGTFEQRKGYIYVVSNYWMFAEEDPAKALEFTGKMVQLISTALEEQLPKEKLESPDTRLAPKPGMYLPSVAYAEFVYRPKPITLRENSVPYSFTAYSRRNQNVQCMIVVALPDNVSTKEKLPERIPMMLEQFAFTASEPRTGQAPAPGGAPPSTPAGAGF